MTPLEEDREILRWLGVWEPGQECSSPTGQTPKRVVEEHRIKWRCHDCGYLWYSVYFFNFTPHDIPQPSLTDTHLLDALEKLGAMGLETGIWKQWGMQGGKGFRVAIRAAVLKYLEGKE